MKEHELVMVGLGLMGTSLIKALQEVTKLRAVGLDIQQEPIEKAISDHVLADGAVLTVQDEKAKRLLAGSRFIVLALYPDSILQFIRTYRDSFQPGSVVMDICGLKGAFVKQAQELMPTGVEYVGTHPMAGKEKSGYENGDGELFIGASFIITPTERNTPETLQVIRRLAIAIGCGRIREIQPEEHDQMIAYTSHLPHVLAAALIRSWHGTEDIVSYAGGSFRDATRVAEINTRLWTQLFLCNREKLLKEVKSCQTEMEQFVQLLESSDQNGMEQYLQEASDRKTAWKKAKEGDRYDGGHL